LMTYVPATVGVNCSVLVNTPEVENVPVIGVMALAVWFCSPITKLMLGLAGAAVLVMIKVPDPVVETVTVCEMPAAPTAAGETAMAGAGLRVTLGWVLAVPLKVGVAG
jgi:hypothetical protein